MEAMQEPSSLNPDDHSPPYQDHISYFISKCLAVLASQHTLKEHGIIIALDSTYSLGGGSLSKESF